MLERRAERRDQRPRGDRALCRGEPRAARREVACSRDDAHGQVQPYRRQGGGRRARRVVASGGRRRPARDDALAARRRPRPPVVHPARAVRRRLRPVHQVRQARVLLAAEREGRPGILAVERGVARVRGEHARRRRVRVGQRRAQQERERVRRRRDGGVGRRRVLREERQASPEIDQEPRAVTPRARRVRARRRVPHHRLDGVGARENRADGDDGGGARRGVRRVGVCALPADELRDLLALAPQHDRADARGARSQNLQMRGGARGRAAAERRPRRDARRRAERRCRDAAPREAEARRLGEDGLIFGRDGGGLAHDLHSEAHVLRRAALAAEHAQAHWSHQPVHRRVPRPARVERRAQKRILARGGGGDHLHGGRLRTVLGHLRRRPRGEDLRADLLGRHAPERVRRVQRLL